jgi:hypothetical protein
MIPFLGRRFTSIVLTSYLLYLPNVSLDPSTWKDHIWSPVTVSILEEKTTFWYIAAGGSQDERDLSQEDTTNENEGILKLKMTEVWVII